MIKIKQRKGRRRNQIKIPHKKNYEELAQTYVKQIQSGFDLTITEMADYLRCSYDYAKRKISYNVSCIVINTTVRQALYAYQKDSDYYHLFRKRLLFNRDDFYAFLRANCTLVTEFEPYYFDDLSDEAQEGLKLLSQQTMFKTEYLYETLANSIVQTDKEKYLRSYKYIQEPLQDVPNRFFRATDLEFDYTTQAYKFIRINAIKKTKLFGLVLYRDQDLKITKRAVFSLPMQYDKSKILASINDFEKQKNYLVYIKKKHSKS